MRLAPISLLGVAAAATMATVPAAAQARVTLSTGHVDVVTAQIERGKLRIVVKDETRGVARRAFRDPSDVLIRVVPKARVQLPSGMSFVGRKGSSAWVIPQTQRAGIIWAGWNTQHVPRTLIRGSLRWSLRSVKGPGKVVLFTTGSFGDHSTIFSSARKLPQTRTLPMGVHVHSNWAFTRRGAYRMRFNLRGTSRGGRKLSATETLLFRVG